MKVIWPLEVMSVKMCRSSHDHEMTCPEVIQPHIAPRLTYPHCYSHFLKLFFIYISSDIIQDRCVLFPKTTELHRTQNLIKFKARNLRNYPFLKPALPETTSSCTCEMTYISQDSPCHPPAMNLFHSGVGGSVCVCVCVGRESNSVGRAGTLSLLQTIIKLHK